MNINDRIKELREYLGLSQREFSNRINIGQSTLAMFETGQRVLKDIHISQICSEFSINEEWLRNGKGDIFIQASEFSLNEYAEKNNLSELEFDILKGYMELDSDVRKKVLSHFKSIFDKHEVAATKEDYIDEELENYRLELEAELKGEISSALEDVKDIEGKAN